MNRGHKNAFGVSKSVEVLKGGLICTFGPRIQGPANTRAPRTKTLTDEIV